MANQPTRYIIRNTTYKPERGLIYDSSVTLITINAALRPWGFRLAYYGYEKMDMWLVYQFTTLKASYKNLDMDKVVVYHHADMDEDEWLAELKSRLFAEGRQAYKNAWRRSERAKNNRKNNYTYKRRRLKK